MSHKANLRRLKALTALVAPALFMAGTVAIGPVYAQGAPPPANKPQQKIPAGEPLGKRKPGPGQRKVGKVGSWSFASQQNYAGADLLPEKIKTRSGGKRVGDRLLGGQAEIKIEYWSIRGPKHGFSGDLVVSSRGNLGGFKTHVFVDGKEVDTFTMGGMGRAGTQRRDLKKLFGKNLEGLVKTRNIRVTIDTGGKSYDIFEVDLEGTAELFAKMRSGPDANYAANNSNRSHRTSSADEDMAIGFSGPSSGSGQVGPWHYGSGGGSKADAQLNLKNVNAQGLDKFVQIARGGLLDETPPRGGWANVEVVYEGAPGPGQGFSGNLVVHRIGESGSYPIHLFVDGKEADSFTLSEPVVKRDLKKAFGEDLSGFAKAREIRVTMEIDGKSYDILAVDLLDKKRLLNTAAVTASKMKDWAERNYRLAHEREVAMAPHKCEDLRRRQISVSRAQGLYGPWEYDYVGSKGYAKLYLPFANNRAAEDAKQFIKIARGGPLDESPPRGGSANIVFTYVSQLGPDQGFGGSLVVNRIGESGNYPVHVFVDGKETDKFRLDKPVVRRELTTIFGPGLPGLLRAKDVRVAMEIDGESYDILSVDLTDKKTERNTANVVATDMEKAAERNSRFSEANNSEFQHWCGLARKAPNYGGGGGGKKCFITTACCEKVGLSDDCFELTALRRFRDGAMAATADGRREIQLYYRLAPLVLDEMRRRGEDGRLLRLYFSHILPCALGAQLGLVGAPRRLYRDMMQRLVRRYRPDQLDSIAG